MQSGARLACSPDKSRKLSVRVYLLLPAISLCFCKSCVLIELIILKKLVRFDHEATK